MLYGNIIFIKKTGGDGSKYPVTEKDIKIGRSEECLIRIYNAQVAPEHCQLIIEENGQATLRNLSNQTILNGKPLGHKDVVLCHGDIFKLGERFARWEYLPTSKYYRQLLSPTGRLVAVVMPQQRPLEEEATSRASASQVGVSKNTPLGKRRYSERATGESSAIKMRKSSCSELMSKTRGNLSKFLTGRHSLKTTKLILQGGRPKERKSISGMISSKTPKGKVGGKLRKSTLPLWKVNIASPPEKVSPIDRKSLKKSNRESVNSPKSVVDTQSKDAVESKPSETYLNKTKTPQKALIECKSSEELLASTSKDVLKTPLGTIVESPSNSGRKSSRPALLSKKSPRTPSLKSPSNLVLPSPKSRFTKLVNSESKISSITKKRLSLSKGRKRMTLMLEKVDYPPIKSSKGKTENFVSEKMLQTPINDSLINEASVIKKTSPRKSLLNTPVQKVSRRSKEVRKSSGKKTSKSAEVRSPTKNSALITPIGGVKNQSRTPRIRISKKLNVVIPQEGLDNSQSPSDSSAKNVSVKKTRGKSDQIAESSSPSRKISLSQKKSLLSSFSSPVEKTTPALNSVRSSQRKRKLSLKKMSALEAIMGESASVKKAKISSTKRVPRKLSPSSSAERAAKELKTISPRKPDKNKKAALLVLGKANRKQLMAQNVKVLLKQKIVKKALKQSSGMPGRKEKGGKKIPINWKQELQKKIGRKKNSKSKKPVKLRKSSEKIASPLKTSKASDASTISFSANNIIQGDTPKGKNVLEGVQPSASKAFQTPSRFSSKNTYTEATPNSSLKQMKESENSETTSPSLSFEKNAENYLLNSFRRCSKRLSSKNDTGRPDFIELSPTALGLMPKNLELFKTPKDNKRRSPSLVTPKNVRTTGIIKSASTSKIGNRKSLRFSPKDASNNSEFSSPSLSEKTEFDFSSFNTPNITTDVFVSPLSEKSNMTKKDVTEFEEEISKSLNRNARTSSETKLCVGKSLQSPQSKKSINVLSNQKVVPRNSKINKNSPAKVLYESKSSENCLSNFEDVQQLFETPKIQKSPKNDLTDVRGVRRLLQTPKPQKSPKNDLTDVRGVKKLLQTPKLQKSPKNDLSDVRGVKKLMRTPKVQKSPKNDLSDVRGVKKLLRTPKVQKSPKNDLTDVKGVKRLLQTPKIQKSPKNDLTDVRGVKRLLQTPKPQKSPKNDLTDVRGVKRLLQTPKIQKSPKNDLTDVRGVKKLLRTPKIQKSPKNELSDLRGVKRLLDPPKSPQNNLLDVSGVGNLFESPIKRKLKSNSVESTSSKKLVESSHLEESSNKNLIDPTEVNQSLISKTIGNDVKDEKTIPRKSRNNDFRAAENTHATYSTSRGPKNDLSDVMGVRELFLRHQPVNDYSINLTGVAELFDLPQSDVDSKQKRGKTVEKSPLQTSEVKSLRSRKMLESQYESEENMKITTRGSRLRKATKEETDKKATKNLKLEAADVKENKTAKRKVVEKVNTRSVKKASVVKKTQKVAKTAIKPGGKTRTTVKSSENVGVEIKSSRKRKTSDAEASDLSPPKLRRKLREAEKSSSTETKETSKKGLLRSKNKSDSGEKISVKRVQKVSAKEKNVKIEKVSKVQIKKAIKATGTKQTQKVQSKRSQRKSNNVSGSEDNLSPRKTRSKKIVTAETVSETDAMKKLSPAVKRSTRRKVK